MLISYRETGRQGTGAGHRRSGFQTSAVSKEDEEKDSANRAGVGEGRDTGGRGTGEREHNGLPEFNHRPSGQNESEGWRAEAMKMGKRAGEETEPPNNPRTQLPFTAGVPALLKLLY